MKRHIYLSLIFICTLFSAIHAQGLKVGTYTFKNGDIYTGQLTGSKILGYKPHGKGKTICKNGDTYEGEYVKGKREGYGVYS